VKVETKEEVKVETKEEVKEEVKVETKEEVKEEVKVETKEEVKTETEQIAIDAEKIKKFETLEEEEEKLK